MASAPLCSSTRVAFSIRIKRNHFILFHSRNQSARKYFAAKLSKLKMGHGFGGLAKVRGIVYYYLSPFEQRAFAGVISHGVPNTLRRISENFFRVAPPFIVSYLVYTETEKEHHRMMRKNPADFENDQ